MIKKFLDLLLLLSIVMATGLAIGYMLFLWVMML